MKRKLCLCASMSTTLNLCRTFGLFPISWTHLEARCHYRISKSWLAYSVMILGLHLLYLTQIAIKVNLAFKNDRKLLIAYISTINENISTTLIVTMILLNMFRLKKMTEMLNSCSALTKNDLLCYTSLRIHAFLHAIFMISFLVLYLIQYSAVFLLNLMDNYDTDWSYERFLMPLIQNTPILFTGLVGTSCTVFITLFTCYEKVMMHNLKFIPVHPMATFDETGETRSLLAVYKYTRCKSAHKLPLDAPFQLAPLRLVEHLKILYERIRNCVDLANVAFSPHMLIYMTLEIIALVLRWYAIIIYFTTADPDPIECTVNFFNWVFVIVHFGGLFVFLDRAQHVETSTHNLVHILMEYSTRISTPDEYQQVRIFLENIMSKRGLNASGIFNVNLKIAGPIAANILMYVLVAVQFKFPSREEQLSK